jgi:hypothetical protein
MIKEQLVISGPYNPISAKGGSRRRSRRRTRRMKSRRNKTNKSRTRRRYH